jgi:uncharacterized protein (TIGR02058 family)
VNIAPTDVICQKLPPPIGGFALYFALLSPDGEQSVSKGKTMAKTRMLAEFGMGTSLRRRDYTGAAERAIRDALWHNSISVAELFGFDKSAMLIDVEIGAQDPDAVDTDTLAAIFPYGQPNIRVTHGGLDIPKPDGSGVTVICNAAITVHFDMEAAS